MQPQPRPSTEEASPGVQRSALFVCTLTSFMGPFMISAVNVALPAIQADLHMNAVQLSWVATAYLLAVAVVLLPAGKVADIHGRKKVFVTGLMVYTLAATLAALATSPLWLLLLRALQGLGAGLFVTTGMAILSSVFPPHKRGRAIGLYVAAVYVGLSVGPFLGGILVQALGWRSIFLLMLPLGVGSVGITWLFLKGEWADAHGQRLDVVGTLLYAAAILALINGTSTLPAPGAWLLMGIGLAGLGIFALQQTRSSHPIFEVRLFAENRTFTCSSLAALLNYSATFALTFLMSLYLQYLQGLPPRAAGLVLMAQPVTMALLSPVAGRLSDRIEPRLLASAGMTVTVVGMLLFAGLGMATALPVIIGNLILLGLGFALFSSPNMSAIMGSVPKEQYGIASGAAATMRLMGQMVSMALATMVLSLTMGTEPISPANGDRFLHAVRLVFAISALLCVVGVPFSFFRGRLHH